MEASVNFWIYVVKIYVRKRTAEETND